MFKRKNLLVLIDITLFFIAWTIAKYITAGDIVFNFTKNGMILFSITGLIALFMLVGFGIYNKIWRYINIKDLGTLAGLSLAIPITSFAIIGVFSNEPNFIFSLCLSLSFCVIILLSRIVYYLYYKRVDLKTNSSNTKRKRVLIIGAGEASEMLIKEINQNSSLYHNYNIVGIIDDDATKINRKIAGIKVLGTTKTIPNIVNSYEIETIFFSVVNIDKKSKKDILVECTKVCNDIKIITKPYDDYLKKPLKIAPINIEDLLGRDVVDIEEHKDLEYLKNKVVLVTGGGGSIGSELCYQISNCNPKKLIILDIYENNAYEIEQKIKYAKGNDFNLHVEIASIRDKDKIESIFSKYKPEVVFHAAAHKHVPLMETNPEEAVKNNVEGTKNVFNSCYKYDVARCILISTDKAVNPTNVMGTTKRICEKLMLSYEKKSNTIFSAVRFGNVLGSNGSVIHLFKSQVEAGGPVKVTHPEITRFFMTVGEAVSLVLTAGSIPKGGEIFVLNMGSPVKIKELAENIIRLYGKVPYEDIDIIYSGLRPGEKLYEELLINNDLQSTKFEKIFIEPFETVDFDALMEEIKILSSYAKNLDKENILKQLNKIVPEFDHKKNL